MVTLPVIVGGAMAMILMMKEIMITRLPMLQPMALTPTGTPTLAPPNTSLVR
jgi:hypothetical protein